MEKVEKYYETSSETTLDNMINDIVSISLISQQNTKKNRKGLNISLKDQDYNDPLRIELNIGFSFARVTDLEIRLDQNANVNDVNTPQFVFDTLKQFGGEKYVSVTIRKDENEIIPEDKYDINLSAIGYPLFRTKNNVTVLENISQKEINKFTSILDTLKVPYTIKRDILKIHPYGRRKKISIESQVEAYQQIIEMGLSPYIYSSNSGYGKAVISEKKKKLFEEDEITRKKYLTIEKGNTLLGLKGSDISMMQMFVEKNFDFKFDEKRIWKIYYYIDYHIDYPKSKNVIKISD